MTKRTNSTPNLISEMFMSMLKSFSIILIIIVVLNNLIWGFYALKPLPSKAGNTHVEINQTGNRDIKQNINN